MPKPLSEQVVVVIGASSGIGRATALEFARRGARVVAAARNAEALATLVDEITASGGAAVAVPTDVAVPEQVRTLAETAETTYGRIDTLVNAAAVSVYARVEDTTDEEFDRVTRVNYLGQVHGVHAVLPALRRAGGGHLIGIGSGESVRAVPLHAAYTASKFALRSFYDTLRMELVDEGAPISVTTVLPAGIDTPFFEHARSKLGAMPKPPPPVYAAEVVARAVVSAVEHPVREVPVGGAVMQFLLGQKLAPAVTDAVLGLVGPRVQRSDNPDDGTDNLDRPSTGPGRISGAHSGTVLQSSAFTALLGRLRTPGEYVASAVSRTRRRQDES